MSSDTDAGCVEYRTERTDPRGPAAAFDARFHIVVDALHCILQSRLEILGERLFVRTLHGPGYDVSLVARCGGFHGFIICVAFWFPIGRHIHGESRTRLARD